MAQKSISKPPGNERGELQSTGRAGRGQRITSSAPSPSMMLGECHFFFPLPLITKWVFKGRGGSGCSQPVLAFGLTDQMAPREQLSRSKSKTPFWRRFQSHEGFVSFRICNSNVFFPCTPTHSSHSTPDFLLTWLSVSLLKHVFP